MRWSLLSTKRLVYEVQIVLISLASITLLLFAFVLQYTHYTLYFHSFTYASEAKTSIPP